MGISKKCSDRPKLRTTKNIFELARWFGEKCNIARIAPWESEREPAQSLRLSATHKIEPEFDRDLYVYEEDGIPGIGFQLNSGEQPRTFSFHHYSHTRQHNRELVQKKISTLPKIHALPIVLLESLSHQNTRIISEQGMKSTSNPLLPINFVA